MTLMRVWPSGNLIDPMLPEPELIDIRDVAFHLAGIFRYGGASRLTVAQHACEMATYALRDAIYTGGKVAESHREFPFECLMHDNAEYLLGDLIRPLKHNTQIGFVYRPIEDAVAAVIRSVFGVSNRHAEKVNALDREICATEQRDLFGVSPVNTLPGVCIHPWTPQHAEREFLRLYYLLKPMGAEGKVAA
jgi:uncharacterized protein